MLSRATVAAMSPAPTALFSDILKEAKPLLKEEEEVLYKAIEELEQKLEKKAFKLAIVALAKCGKSTINNAFIGRHILPANNVPETSVLTFIVHNPNLTEPRLAVYSDPTQVLANTHSGVLSKITEINKSIRDGNLANQSWKNLLLETNVMALDGMLTILVCSVSLLIDVLGVALEHEMRFEIVDSPGYNEQAVNDEVRSHVQNLVALADSVLYLFDYTKLGTSEDESFLKDIANQRPDIVKSILYSSKQKM